MPEFAIGTKEEGQAMIGFERKLVAESPVSRAMVRTFAALVEDANPAFWDVEDSTNRWGGELAPAAVLAGWLLAPPWHPWEVDEVTEAAHITFLVPLPGPSLINAESDVTFYRPIVVGDELTVTERVESISEEKATRLGKGHFITTRSTYRNAAGEVVADLGWKVLRFTPEEGQ